MHQMNFLKLMFTALPASNAGPGAINQNDAIKIIRMVLVGTAGYALTLLVQLLTPMDFGAWQPIVQIALMGLTEVGRRFLSSKPDSTTELPPNPAKGDIL